MAYRKMSGRDRDRDPDHDHLPLSDNMHTMNPWQPGVGKRIPWGGISCLLGVFCCGVVEIAILLASNGKPIDSWKYPPSLFLSMAYTIGNILLAGAFSQGLTVRTPSRVSQHSIDDRSSWCCRFIGGVRL